MARQSLAKASGGSPGEEILAVRLFPPAGKRLRAHEAAIRNRDLWLEMETNCIGRDRSFEGEVTARRARRLKPVRGPLAIHRHYARPFTGLRN